MSTGNNSFLEIAVWLFLVLIALAISPYALAVFWQFQTKNILKSVGARLRQIQAQTIELSSSASFYSPSDPEPYGSLATALFDHIKSILAQTQAYYAQYAQTRQSIHSLVPPQDWRILVRLPVEWYHLWKSASEIQHNLERHNRAVEMAYGMIDKLNAQGWEVAQQARQLLQDDQKTLHLLESIRARDISDANLDGWIGQAQKWENVLKSQVPVYFMSGSQEEILAQPDRQAVSEVFRIVADGRPAVEALAIKSREWDTQTVALEKACAELASGFAQLNTEMREMETNPVRPMIWDRSRKTMAVINQQIESVNQGKRPRTLDTVKKDLATSLSLITQIDELTETCRKAAAGHSELLGLLGSHEVQGGLDWVRGAQKLSEGVSTYDPENWPRADGAARLRADLQALYDHQQRLTNLQAPAPGRPAGIKETELEANLADARRLSDLHHELRPRVSSIQKRYVEIQTAETKAREEISRARALLNQSESILASNPLLSKNVPEAKSTREALESALTQLEKPEKGAVEAKANRAADLVRKAEASANTWLATLRADLESKKAGLMEKTERLAAIALLDTPALSEAQRLLASPPEDNRGTRASRSAAGLSFAEVIAELKRNNDDWQKCTGVLKELDETASSVLEAYEKANNLRQAAAEGIARAEELIPAPRTWPPTTQNVGIEKQEFTRIDGQWQTLQKEHFTPIRLVTRLGDLAQTYQGLAGRLTQKVERASQEQNRFRELEHRLSESRAMWQEQMQVYADNLSARDEIHLLLEEVEEESEAIRQQYRQGEIMLNQAFQALRQTCQKLDQALIPLDENQGIDITGEVQRLYS